MHSTSIPPQPSPTAPPTAAAPPPPSRTASPPPATSRQGSRRRYPATTHHQFTKVNRSRLAFSIAGSCGITGVAEEACGLRHRPGARSGPIPLSPGPSSLAPPSIKNLKSGSTGNSLVTNQELTRGLFKRLDGVIAYPEEITNPRLPFSVDPATLQLVCARYDC